MNILVVYYSLTGNTAFVAKTIAETWGADLLELKPQKDIASKGFMRYVWGGAQVTMAKKPALEALGKNPKDYDVLFIGTPVWAWTFAPGLRSFFSDVKLSGKKIALFCCAQASFGKTIEHMKKQLLNNEFIGELKLIEPLNEKEKNSEKIKAWCETLASCCAAGS